MSDIYVSSLSIYPLKSAAPVVCDSLEMTSTGPKGDRQYMLIKMDGTFVTGRTHPKITSIDSDYQNEKLVLSHPSCQSLTLNVADFLDEYVDTVVWGTKITAQRCTEQADQWVSELLGEPLRILYFSKDTERRVVGHTEFNVGFADGFPLLITNEASLDHLNQRLLADVSMQNFRSNIVISEASAWQEDGWAKIRIGEVVFDLVKPCGRCIFTTVDPTTATLDAQLEPLNTLSSYRKDPQGSDVIFGENMLPLNSGVIRVGDKIEVLQTKAPPKYIDNWDQDKRRLTTQLSQAQATQLDKKLYLRCIDIIDETADVKTFTFVCDPITRLAYFPGQFITIHPSVDNIVHNRCYTLSSSPSRPDTISITVKRVENGKVSNYLHDYFSVGSSIQCTPPAGVFYLHAKVKPKVLLLSAGSGITPMLSMLRFIVDTSQSIDVHFHYSAKTAADLIGFDEIMLMRKRFKRLQVSVNFSVQQSAGLESVNTSFGRLTSEMIVEHCADYLQRDVFVCGPDGFMDNAAAALKSIGLPDEQYDQESFSIDSVEQSDEQAQSYKVRFSASDIEVVVSSDQNIIEAAEDAGIYPDYSCLAGVCGSCTTQLISGDIYAPNAKALDEEDIEQGLFLPCCSFARSDLEVDL
jgi:uncharacterized protein YcbX/ferredoxin-NADP reductase